MASAWSSRTLAAAAFVAILCTSPSSGAQAALFSGKDAALHDAFPDADRIEDRNFVLTEAQAQAIEAQAQVPLERKIWTLYAAYRGSDLLGWV